jgi:hypothetical protein
MLGLMVQLNRESVSVGRWPKSLCYLDSSPPTELLWMTVRQKLTLSNCLHHVHTTQNVPAGYVGRSSTRLLLRSMAYSPTLAAAYDDLVVGTCGPVDHSGIRQEFCWTIRACMHTRWSIQLESRSLQLLERRWHFSNNACIR